MLDVTLATTSISLKSSFFISKMGIRHTLQSCYYDYYLGRFWHTLNPVTTTSFFSFLLLIWKRAQNQPKELQQEQVPLKCFPRGEEPKPRGSAKSFSLMMKLLFYQNINFIPDLPNKLIQSNSTWLVTIKSSDQSYK